MSQGRGVPRHKLLIAAVAVAALALGAVASFLTSRPEGSEEHTSELQSRGLISYAVFCLKKKKKEKKQKKKKKNIIKTKKKNKKRLIQKIL